MKKAYTWLIQDIFGLHIRWRSKHERRNSRWRVAGWVLAVSPWAALIVAWWAV